MKKNLTLLFFLAAILGLQAQKKTMDHDVYGIWKKIDQQRLSNDGKWVSYITLSNTEGDPKLYLWNAAKGATTTFERATEGRFTEDNTYLIFKIKQPLDSMKAKRRKKMKDEDLPKDSLGIYTLATGELRKVANVKSYIIPQKWSGFVAYQLEIDNKNPKSMGKDSSSVKSKIKKEDKESGSKVILHNLMTNRKDTFMYATDFTFAKEGKQFMVADTGLDSLTFAGVHVFDCAKNTLRTIFRKKGKYKQIALDESGEQAAFLADLDTSKIRVRPYDMMFWNTKLDSAKAIARSNKDYGSMKNVIVSENAKPVFSEDGSKLYFGIAPQPILNDTTLLPEEIVSVEVWSHTDTRLHTQQKVQLEAERKRSYDVVYHTGNQKLVPVADLDLPEVIFTDNKNADVAIGYSDEAYARSSTWEGYAARDYYVVDLKTGNKSRIAQKIRGAARLSPFAKYVYWYSALDSVWMAYSIANKNTIRMTDNKTVPFYEEENDVPDNPSAYGGIGWLKDDKAVLTYDRYDIWYIDPLSLIAQNGKNTAKRLTMGRPTKTVYRYIKLDDEERFIEPNARVVLHTFNETTKKEGYAYLDLATNTMMPIMEDNFKYAERVIKAKNAPAMITTKQNFQTFPDLLYTTDLKNMQRISDVNPQQSEYNWGSIELVEWTSLDGQKLRGMLIKPANFDPKKKYPMIVNFYEKSSDDLNNYRTLEPLRSQVNYSFYSNRGYLIFNPDVPYRIGYPGESSMSSVMPGVTHLIDQGFVDEKRIAIQGHSWGGYQAAYLVTKTNMFRCAGIGAPVVNMISAYGGIRWESGVMRMFQYEHTQSRIGGSIWQYPLRYLENSPIFSVDKIQTPVLILHNDKDGAVPWYQGIEFFGALRRLDKPVWMLNYNEEPHWPVKLQNRIDYQIRLQQFFDYYLKDAPMPRWMQRGVPAIEKGIRQGLEVTEVGKN